MAEIRIPSDRIPAHILSMLQEIGHSMLYSQTATTDYTSATTSPSCTDLATSSSSIVFSSSPSSSSSSSSGSSVLMPSSTTAMNGIPSTSTQVSNSVSMQGASVSTFQTVLTEVPLNVTAHKKQSRANPCGEVTTDSHTSWGAQNNFTSGVARSACPAQIHIEKLDQIANSSSSSTSCTSTSFSQSVSHSSLPFPSFSSSATFSPQISKSSHSSQSVTGSTTSCGLEARASQPISVPFASQKRVSPSAHCDETDGCDSAIVHVLEQSPLNPKAKTNSKDESDIVRVFPLDSDHERDEEVDSAHNYPMDDDSGIVKIFPERTSPNFEKRRTASPSRLDASDECDTVRVFPELVQEDHSNLSPSETCKPSNLPSIQSPPSFQSVPFPGSNHQGRYNSPLRPTATSRNNKPSRLTQSPISTSQRQIPNDNDRLHPRHLPTMPGTPRRTPEILTPPQTPDDAELLDDEVFSYDVVTDVVGSRRRALDSLRQNQETTPKRDSAGNLRRNSDSRSVDMHHAHNQRFSPFSPAQRLSELNVGDRQHTRKRLSFEEEDMYSSPGSHKTQYHSEPILSRSPFHVPQNSFERALPDRSFNQSPISSTSKSQNCGSVVSAQPIYRQGSVNSNYPYPQQQYSSFQTLPNDLLAPPSVKQQHSPNQSSSRITASSPFREVTKILEHLSSPRPSSPAQPRSRFMSTEEVEGSRDPRSSVRRSPSPHDVRPRGHSMSYGKRRRLDEDLSASPSQQQQQQQIQQFRSPSTSEEPREDCACATIERNFLQMAECAYKNIRRMDASTVDFHRFRQELAQTNTILRESLAIIENFKGICEHRNSSLSQNGSYGRHVDS